MRSPSHVVRAPLWSTSSFDGIDDEAHAGTTGLADHVRRCRGAEGRWHPLLIVADVVDGVLTGRLVTTIAIATALIGTAVWIG